MIGKIRQDRKSAGYNVPVHSLTRCIDISPSWGMRAQVIPKTTSLLAYGHSRPSRKNGEDELTINDGKPDPKPPPPDLAFAVTLDIEYNSCSCRVFFKWSLLKQFHLLSARRNKISLLTLREHLCYMANTPNTCLCNSRMPAQHKTAYARHENLCNKHMPIQQTKPYATRDFLCSQRTHVLLIPGKPPSSTNPLHAFVEQSRRKIFLEEKEKASM